jgi:hypothetical protein
MREQRQRKALYVNRREELYPPALLQKEYAEKKKKRKTPAARAKPKAEKASGTPRRRPAR